MSLLERTSKTACRPRIPHVSRGGCNFKVVIEIDYDKTRSYAPRFQGAICLKHKSTELGKCDVNDLEWFSNDGGKVNTKESSPTNHNRNKQRN